jgi:uncharacterized membrane protein YedE/YeeE
MSRHEALSDWTQELSSHMPHLSKPQAAVLAMWSYGMALTRTCSCYTIALFLALLLQRKMYTVRQQLRASPTVGRRGVLCSLAALGGALVGGHDDGLGRGCHNVE